MYRTRLHCHGMSCNVIYARMHRSSSSIHSCTMQFDGVLECNLRPPFKASSLQSDLSGSGSGYRAGTDMLFPKGQVPWTCSTQTGQFRRSFMENDMKRLQAAQVQKPIKIPFLLRSGWLSWPEYGFLKSTLQVSPCTSELSTDIRRSATRTCAHHSGIRCISFCTLGPDFGLP